MYLRHFDIFNIFLKRIQNSKTCFQRVQLLSAYFKIIVYFSLQIGVDVAF